MRPLVSIFCALFTGAIFAQNINLALQSKTTYAGQTLSNIWGYAAGGNEYALIGAENGMIVTNVTNPAAPVQIVQIPGPPNRWREIKTYQHYAYIVSEGGGGLQIVDLAPLPSAALPVYTYTGGGTTPTVLSTVHALQVDEAKGYLYLYGSDVAAGHACIFDLNQHPTAPVYKGYYAPVGYVHDGYVNNDTMYAAHIYEGLVSIADMTNKSGPGNLIGVPLATPIATPSAFPHNTWRYGNTLFTTDEIANATLTAYDISDLSDIKLLDRIQSNPGSGSVVHNTYIRNGYAITSWNVDGMTIVDVSRPANLIQVGNYDTYPYPGTGNNGAWGVYPFLPSGNILVSNRSGSSVFNGELFVLTPTFKRGCYVEGLITDAITGYPINGAKAELLNTTTANSANAFGAYKMGQLQSGTYIFQVSKAGYNPYKKYIHISNGVLTTVNAALVPVGGCTYISTHNSQNFETSWGIWIDGGVDCARINNAAYASSPPYSIQLRDNTNSSLMTTTNQDLVSYSEIYLRFSYLAVSFEPSEVFWLQVSTDGGMSYTTVDDFKHGTDFINGVRKNASVTIPGPFTATTRFRFRSNASSVDDQVYIDNVMITGCMPSLSGGGGEEEIMVADVPAKVPSADIFELKTGPNPTSDAYLVQFRAGADVRLDYVITDVAGRVVRQDHYTCNQGYNQLSIGVRDLAAGTYLLSLATAESQVAQKLVVSK